MKKPGNIFRELMAIVNLDRYSNDEALEYLAKLADLSLDLRKDEGLNHVICISRGIQGRELTPKQEANLNYYLANVWGSKRIINIENESPWHWERQVYENEIIHLRRALKKDGFSTLSQRRQCEILTNLGNIMDTVGRFVEAIEYWDRGLVKKRVCKPNCVNGPPVFSQILFQIGSMLSPSPLWAWSISLRYSSLPDT